MCLAHLFDDGFEMENSCLCSLDLRSEELLAMPALFFFFHFINSIFPTGGHGFYSRQRGRCTRQSPLGKIFLGKGSLPSAFYPDTRQNKKNCRVLGAALGKIFSAIAAPVVNGYFAECPTQHSAKKIYFFKKITLPSAPAQALGKVFFIFF